MERESEIERERERGRERERESLLEVRWWRHWKMFLRNMSCSSGR